ncbi:hypothetical protein FISHEDRAFT_65189 [Fistulina hepatica ATCC 64428]|uniref:Phospholipase/carboxylesterase/thioesterase domain-containing protein n=1 Tax=Fistulina hepatica ATCC 64428 TaxID=1128425 RepID=A0A0D7AF88_9AGAR|nr:hypothetical protein FISHEDRAFT_65189 [Fistulina hepatica ATCC 64428]
MNVKETPSSSAPKAKIAPDRKAMPTPFEYFPSDGTDENLLIMLHGLGDTHRPFARAGKQLRLPQTAVLAICAPSQIPFMDEESYQWYISFTPLGEVVERPDPTPGLNVLSKAVDHLLRDCSWSPHQLHLFGFAQGGSVAAEFGLNWWKERCSPTSAGASTSPLGSIVTVSGPLLSYPTLNPQATTPVLVVHRPPQQETTFPGDSLVAFRKGYRDVREVVIGQGSTRTGMPASKDEWEPIMRFWSEHLGRRMGDGLYEVMAGTVA